MKIEKGIPIPKRRMSNAEMSDVLKMEIGDSVFFDGATSHNDSRIQRWRRASKINNLMFVFRKVEAGYRMWRLA